MTALMSSSPGAGDCPPPGGRDFTEFFRDVEPKVVGMLIVYGLSTWEAEDIAQEAMADMFEKWPAQESFDYGESARYAFIMAISKTRDLWRRDRFRKSALHAALRVLWCDPVAEIVIRDEALLLARRLPRNQRRVFLLTYHGLSTEEIADLLQISASAVSSHLSTARKALRSGKDFDNDSR